MWPFRRRKPQIEQRASGGFTSEMLSARHAWLSGRRGFGELTATVQACVSLWEHGFALADVIGTDLLDRHNMALLGRSLAVRGEAVFLIREDHLQPASDWDVATRDGQPRAYRLDIPDTSGGRSRIALAAEVLHVRTGISPEAPWVGVSPLRRASLTAGLLHALEAALAEIYENAPLGSQIVPMPEMPGQDMGALGRGFRGQHGRVLLRESTTVSAAGGPAPPQDWKPQDVSPDLSRSMTAETLAAAREAILTAFGALPTMFSPSAAGPAIREGQRHFAQWTLQPVAALVAEETSAKLGVDVKIDILRPLQAYDVGGRARALRGFVEAMATAKGAGLEGAELDRALQLVGWGE